MTRNAKEILFDDFQCNSVLGVDRHGGLWLEGNVVEPRKYKVSQDVLSQSPKISKKNQNEQTQSLRHN